MDKPAAIQKITRQTLKTKILLYGPTGSGKTHTATHIDTERFGNVMFINFETKDESAPEGIDQWKIKNRDDLVDAYNYLANGGQQHYGVIVFDGITEYLELLIEDLKRPDKEWSKKQESMLFADYKLGVLTPGGWGYVGSRIRTVVTKFRDLDAHVIFTASEEMKDTPSGIPVTIPGISGKTTNKVCGKVSHIGHMETRASQNPNEPASFQVRFTSTQFVTAKTEGGKLNAVEPADMNVIFSKLLNQPSEDKGE